MSPPRRSMALYDQFIERFRRERTAVTGMPETYQRHSLRFPAKFSVLGKGAAAGPLRQVV
ncbi:hypothetical protein [Streptomyces sp. NPDC101165]|uniref:hypothetical protein n=1 Tax=Streptomyces sp. NPDC101165 TaxID=3366119 RepID=UPI0037F1CF1E